MQTPYLSMSPTSGPGYLIIPEVQQAFGHTSGLSSAMPVVGRHFTENFWRPSQQVPTPETMRDWEYITEPAWVARCLLHVIDRPLQLVISQELNQIKAADEPSILQLYKDITQQFDGTGGWALGLSVCANDSWQEIGQRLLDRLCREHPASAPSLGGWANHVALLGLTSSFRLTDSSKPDYERMLTRMAAITPPSVLGRMLADIQIFYDNSHQMYRSLLEHGMGRYRWYWSTPQGAETVHDIPLVFLRTRDAVEWMCESMVPPGQPDDVMYSNPRRRLRPLREMIREGQLSLGDFTTGSQVEPIDLVRLIDEQTTPRRVGVSSLA